MKFLLDFGPIILFFIVYKYYGLYAAIYAMIASTFVQIMYTRFSTGKFVTSHVLTFALLLVFGGISIILRDPAFVMWKVSVLYVIFAAAKITYKTLTFHMTNAGSLRMMLIPPNTSRRANVRTCEVTNFPVLNRVYIICTNVEAIIA